jgi:AcrR family transcriptional regulator
MPAASRKLPFPPAPAWRRKGELTAGRILDAAEALFAERGYAGTSLRDVAERVGLRIPSLYNHFASKDALYAAVLARGFGPVLELLGEFAGQSAAERDDRALITRVMAVLRRHPHLPRLIQHETLAGGERLTPMLREWIAPVFGRAGEVAESTPGASRWRPEDRPLLVIAVYNVLVGYFTFAPLYRQIEGVDLLAEPSFERQTRLLGEIVTALFSGSRSTDSDPGSDIGSDTDAEE